MFTRLFALFALILPTALAAQTLEATLDNGLKVIVREDSRAPVATVQMWYKVGSADEIAGKSGLSHALEHMMFKGSKNVPSGEHSRRIAALGGSDNAYTNTDETVYHATVAAEHLNTVLELEADRMAHLNFSDADFLNEMKVIREERRQTLDDDPFGKMYAELRNRAFDKTPNRTPVIGHMADLHTLGADDLRRWYRRWYAPNNALLVIVGDVSAEHTIQNVRKLFGGIAPRKLPTRADLNESERKTQAVSASITGSTHQPVFMLAYRVPKLQQPDDKMPYALSLLSTVLGGHPHARFARNLVRSKQTALHINSEYTLIGRSPSLFVISAMPSAHATLSELKAQVAAEIADIAQNGISEAELAHAKTAEHAHTVYSKDSMEHQATLIGSLERNGFSHRDEDAFNQRIQAVSAADIQAAARLLTPQRETYIQLYPN